MAKKPYCTQNNGDCKTCSLVNYNYDCQNNPIRGGKRPGAGRPASNVNRQAITRNVTQEEKQAVDELLKNLRSELK